MKRFRRVSRIRSSGSNRFKFRALEDGGRSGQSGRSSRLGRAGFVRSGRGNFYCENFFQNRNGFP